MEKATSSLEMKASPSNRTAEEALLSSIIKGGVDSYEKASTWISEDAAFYFSDTQCVWKAVKRLSKLKTPIDEVTLIHEAGKSWEKETMGDLAYYITGLVDVGITSNAYAYAKIVWEKHIQRQVIDSSWKLYDDSFDDNNRLSLLLEKHRRFIEELIDFQPDKKKEIEDIARQAQASIKDRGNMISFNWPMLDHIAGGMTRKEITVVGGRPGHGKTTFMINVVKNLVEANRKVMVFNREMSNIEMIKKLVVLESKGISYRHIRHGEMSDEEEMEVVTIFETFSKKYKDMILYDDVRRLEDTMREIRRHKPDVIIDDFIQLIQVSGADARRFEIEQILQEYKWICKKMNCSALLVSQLNREIERRIEPRPMMSDYAESGSIEQTAETAMFVFYGFNYDSNRFDRYESEIIVGKARYGRVATYQAGFNGDRCKFYSTRDQAADETYDKISKSNAKVTDQV